MAEHQLEIKVLENKLLAEKIEHMKELHTKEIDFLKELYENKFHKKEIEFLKELHEKNIRLQEMKTDLANTNAQYLEATQAFDPRGILEQFEAKKVNMMSGANRDEKWRNYAKSSEAQNVLKEIEFSNETIVGNTVVGLFKKLNSMIHETYYQGKKVHIKEGFLSNAEWKVMKAVWKLFPLPPGTLLICRRYEDPEVMA